MDSISLSDIIKAIDGKLINTDPGINIKGVSTNTRSLKQGEIFFALDGKNYDGHKFIKQAIDKGAIGVIVSNTKKNEYFSFKGLEKCVLIEVADTLKALGDLASYYRQCLRTRFVAITGSNGKTTTKDMVYHVLKNFKNVSRSRNSHNNFVGVPLTIFETDRTHDFCVVEMGTNAPGEIKRLSKIISPNFTILTNIAHAHLEGLGSIEGVADEKAEFIENMDKNGTLITNTDDYWCNQISSRFNGRIISFGFKENVQIRASKVKRNKSGFVFTVNGSFPITLPVLGKHNIYNSLATIAVCSAIGINIEEICKKFSDFKLPSMRMEKQICGDIVIINDSYNSNPSSMLAALDEFSQLPVPGRKILVCGDMLELGEEAEKQHKQIGEKVAKAKIDVLLTVGPFSGFVAEGAIDGGMPSENVLSYKTSEEICYFVASLLKSKDTILIKGSRKMKLESVLHQIKNCCSEEKTVRSHSRV
ncbi:MAG: UDP-N-acetylmuramoyl-tripeptide--D-alanyl-D-alanine ligase [Candidatus Scalinduaceae bacterium]